MVVDTAVAAPHVMVAARVAVVKLSVANDGDAYKCVYLYYMFFII